MGGRGGRGRANTWTRDGGGGGGGGGRHAGNSHGNGNAPAHGVRRRDLLQEDLVRERPSWALSCYGPRGDEPNLLGGDTCAEEVRWASYAALRAHGHAQGVYARVKACAEAKANDIKGILSFPEHQLKTVLDRVAAGQMAPAGLDRVIDERALAEITSGAGVSAGGVGAASAFGGGAMSTLSATAPAFAPPHSAFGGRGGGFVAHAGAPSPIAAAPAFGGGFSPAQHAPLTPDPNVPDSDAWCASAFHAGKIPDGPPPQQYIR